MYLNGARNQAAANAAAVAAAVARSLTFAQDSEAANLKFNFGSVYFFVSQFAYAFACLLPPPLLAIKCL